MTKTIGVKLKACFVCGKMETTRHHVIPREFKPMKNLTIPLCMEHKDITHTIVRQFYFPERLRIKLNRMNTQINNLSKMLESIRKELNFHDRFIRKGKKATFNTPIARRTTTANGNLTKAVPETGGTEG